MYISMYLSIFHTKLIINYYATISNEDFETKFNFEFCSISVGYKKIKKNKKISTPSFCEKQGFRWLLIQGKFVKRLICSQKFEFWFKKISNPPFREM